MDKIRLIRNNLPGILVQVLILILNLINRRYLISFIGKKPRFGYFIF